MHDTRAVGLRFRVVSILFCCYVLYYECVVTLTTSIANSLCNSLGKCLDTCDRSAEYESVDIL
jgi:hypothetical protein